MEPLDISEYRPDQEAMVHRFFEDILGNVWSEEMKSCWRWMNNRARHFMVVKDERILGNATMLHQDFVKPNNELIDFQWITQFFVSKELIGQGMGKRLTQKLESESLYLGTFGQTDAAKHCFTKLNWGHLHNWPMCARQLLLKSFKEAKGYKFKEIDFDSPCINEIWNARGDRKYSMGLRDQVAMKKRFVGRPGVNYKIYVAMDGDTPQGWIVLRSIKGKNRKFGRISVGMLIDIFTRDDDQKITDFLVQSALHQLSKERLMIALSIMTSGAVEMSLKAQGFEPNIKFFGFNLKSIPEKRFLYSAASQQDLGFPLHLSFMDCDAELTF